MAYDEVLAERVRELVDARAGEHGVITERKMFGGLAFLVSGAMSVGVSHVGGLLLRVDPAHTEALLACPGASPMMMRGREMNGWVRVSADAVASRRSLDAWVRLGVDQALSLATGPADPAKRSKVASKKPSAKRTPE